MAPSPDGVYTLQPRGFIAHLLREVPPDVPPDEPDDGPPMMVCGKTFAEIVVRDALAPWMRMCLSCEGKDSAAPVVAFPR